MSASDAASALRAIRLLVLDVDGVMTDGRLLYGADGEALKVFHVRDGLGLKRLIHAGVQVAVLSGRRSAAVDARCRELGIAHVEQGCDDKVAALKRICAALDIRPGECLGVVDDTTDLPLMQTVGVAVAVADAHPQVLRVAHRVTERPGGAAAVREVCDWLLAARGLQS